MEPSALHRNQWAYVISFISMWVYIMLNKIILGVKKVRGQSEAALQMGMCDQNFDIS